MIKRHKSEVARLLGDRRWRLKHLWSFRDQFGEDALFDVLFEPFDSTSSEEYSFNDQQIAADFLMELAPRCVLDVKEVIERSLGQWNLSIEELPFYLADKFGEDAVLAAIDELESQEGPGEQAMEQLATYRFWLRIKARKADGETGDGEAT